MDALPSPRRNDPNPLSHVLASNVRSEPELSPIFKLPTELTMLIFLEYRSSSGPPIFLTHTCRRWRQIAINDASLWTSISIQTTHRRPRLGRFLAFLGMQFERSANLPLHIEWYAVIGNEHFLATLRWIRDKAPFSRWRTLVIDLTNDPYAYKDASWLSVDAFTNLESLTVSSRTDNTVLAAIDRAITSALKVLRLRIWEPRITTTLAKSLTHISSLRLELLGRNAPPLPANVVNLQLDRGEAVEDLFPHLQTCDAPECIFYKDNADVRNLTTLIVRGPLKIRCRVFLPALRKLTLETLEMDEHAEIEAPALDDLYFMDGGNKAMGLSSIKKALKKPGYLLSPKTSLTIDPYFPSAARINLLAKSPEVTHATFGFNDWFTAQTVLKRLAMLGAETDSRLTKNASLCPRLSDLRLDFGWNLSKPSVSKQWLLDKLKARGEFGMTLPLSIYVGWKGKGTYALLTAD